MKWPVQFRLVVLVELGAYCGNSAVLSAARFFDKHVNVNVNVASDNWKTSLFFQPIFITSANSQRKIITHENKTEFSIFRKYTFTCLSEKRAAEPLYCPTIDGYCSATVSSVGIITEVAKLS